MSVVQPRFDRAAVTDGLRWRPEPAAMPIAAVMSPPLADSRQQSSSGMLRVGPWGPHRSMVVYCRRATRRQLRAANCVIVICFRRHRRGWSRERGLCGLPGKQQERFALLPNGIRRATNQDAFSRVSYDGVRNEKVRQRATLTEAELLSKYTIRSFDVDCRDRDVSVTLCR
jgi:hypothetical protein